MGHIWKVAQEPQFIKGRLGGWLERVSEIREFGRYKSHIDIWRMDPQVSGCDLEEYMYGV